MTLERDTECPPKKSPLFSWVKSLFAAGFRAGSKQTEVQSQPQFHAPVGGLRDIASVVATENAVAEKVQFQPPFIASGSGLASGDVASVVARENVAAEKGEESQRLSHQDGNSLSTNTRKFQKLKDEKLERGDDQKDETIAKLKVGEKLERGDDEKDEIIAKLKLEEKLEGGDDEKDETIAKLKLDEKLERRDDERDEKIATLTDQIKDLEKQVKEQKEWAYQKAVQAAKKLSIHLLELKTLRMEREEMQRFKEGKQTPDNATMKKLSEMENALKTANDQVERIDADVRQLETRNAEIRAEIEASKLSASESISSYSAISKREKKLLAWEKQKGKLEDEIANEKEKVEQLHQVLTTLQEAQKEAETKWREELKAKEQAASQVKEERRAKKEAETSNKKKLEAVRQKVEMDFQRHKDDLRRLEQELSRLKSSAESTTELNQPLRNEQQGGTTASVLNELTSSEKGSSYDRECIVCMKDEVSVVFLPCTHQVMCANCSDKYGKKDKAMCPCCGVPIEQRIRVFGAGS